jgi:hypothetical protein
LSDSYHEEPLRYNEAPKEVEYCAICGVSVTPPRINNLYCQNCYDHLEQAYKWLHKPLVSAEEDAELNKRMMDLTDIKKIAFE